MDPSPPPAPEIPEPSAPEPRADLVARPPLAPWHAALLAVAFALAAGHLSQPLWRSLGMRGAPADPRRQGFADSIAVAHLAKSWIALHSLSRRYPALASGAASADKFVAEIEESAEKAVSPRSIALHMIALRYLRENKSAPPIALPNSAGAGPNVAAQENLHAEEPTDEEAALRRLWASLPAPTEADERRERELVSRLVLASGPADPGEIVWLRERLGFCGRLAEAFGADAQDVARAEALRTGVEAESLAYLLKFLAIFGTGAVGALAGLGLLAAFVGASFAGKTARRFDPPRLSPALHFETFTVAMGSIASVSLLAQQLNIHYLGPALAIEFAMLGAVFYPLVRGARWSDLRADLGLTRGRGLAFEAALAPLAYLALLPMVLAAVLFMVLVLVKWLGFELAGGMHPIVQDLANEGASPWRRVSILVLAVVLAPLQEELIFRGFFYRALRGWMGPAAAIALSALLFAAIHPQGVIGLPMLFAVGAMLGALREWRGSLIPSMLTHACINGVSLTIFLLIS